MNLNKCILSLIVLIMLSGVASAATITMDITGLGSVYMTDGFNSFTVVSTTELGVTESHTMDAGEVLTVTATPASGYSTTFQPYSGVISGAQVIHVAFVITNQISNVYGNFLDDDKTFDLHWSQTETGEITIYIDGIPQNIGIRTASANSAITNKNYSVYIPTYGNHLICVNSACMNATNTPTLGLVRDTISISHEITLRRTIPVEVYNPAVLPATDPLDNSYIINIANVPLDHLPSGGSSYRISDSELVLLYSKMINYPGSGYMNLEFWNKDTNTLIYGNNFNLPACAGNCVDFEYWSWWGFIFTGKFSWEIVNPGYYNATVKTSWGEAEIVFQIIDDPSIVPTPTPTPTPEPTPTPTPTLIPLEEYVKLNIGFNELNKGSLSVYFNDIYQGTVSVNTSLNLEKGSSFKLLPNPNSEYVADHSTLNSINFGLGSTYSDIQTNMTFVIFWSLANTTSGNFWYLNKYTEENPIRIFACAGDTDGKLYTKLSSNDEVLRGDIPQGMCSNIYLNNIAPGNYQLILKNIFGVVKTNEVLSIGSITTPAPTIVKTEYRNPLLPEQDLDMVQIIMDDFPYYILLFIVLSIVVGVVILTKNLPIGIFVMFLGSMVMWMLGQGSSNFMIISFISFIACLKFG